jgi:hypothetical protein
MITCSLSLFLDMYLSPHVVQKRLYRKTSVGEAHRDHETKFNQENHGIWKVINQGPCTTKWAPSSCSSRPPGLPIGPAGPSPRLLTLRFVHGQV